MAKLVRDTRGRILTDSLGRNLSNESPHKFNIEVVKAVSKSVKKPSYSTLLHLDNMISSLKAEGIWQKLDTFAIFQLNDNQVADFALYDYKRDVFMTAYGGMIYDEFGYQGNGIDGYIDTEFNPSTDGDNYTQDDASRLFWLSKNPTGAGQSYVDVSSNTPNSGNTNYFRIFSATIRMLINQGTTLLSGGNVNSLGLGFKAINRTSSTDVAVFNGTTKNARTATSSEINNAKQLLFTSGNGYSDMGLGCKSS